MGVSHEKLDEYEIAIDCYFKACEYNHKYLAAHVNLIYMFDKLKFTDADILATMKKYLKLDPFMFYYFLGSAYD
jgi:hypothetical protein